MVSSSSSSSLSAAGVAVVMLPFGAQGHMNPLLYFSSRLISGDDQRISAVYFAGASRHIHRIKGRIHGWDPSSAANMHFHEFNTSPFDPINGSFSAFVVAEAKEMRDPFHNFVKQISTKYRKVVVVYDYLMSYLVQDIDTIHNAEGYRFHAVSDCYSFCYQYLKSDLRRELPPEVAEVLKVTSPPALHCPEDIEFHHMQETAKRVFSGDIFNSNRNINRSFLDLLEKEKMGGMEKIWALGPLSPILDENTRTHHESLDWLDKQDEPNSVVFVSFGTTASFSDEQLRELAFGLEKSEQKFIWVLRDADIDGASTRRLLPLGFEERVKERGIIVRDWAPQMEILSHSATGGFLTHCGWNSCMESISCGLAMATWPILFDHPSIAVYITKVLKIGVEVLDWERREEIVSAVTIEKALRKLMMSEEGEEIRERAKQLGNIVKKSMMEGGNEMDLFIAQITM